MPEQAAGSPLGFLCPRVEQILGLVLQRHLGPNCPLLASVSPRELAGCAVAWGGGESSMCPLIQGLALDLVQLLSLWPSQKVLGAGLTHP